MIQTLEQQLAERQGVVEGVGTFVQSEATIRQAVLEAKKAVDRGNLELSRCLSEIYHKEFYLGWGYKNFENYCHAELDYSYRKAKYLVEVWDRLKSMEYPAQRIEAIGWTKLAEIARVMNADNADLWVEKAETLTVRELSMDIKNTIDRQIPDNRPHVTYLKFKLDSNDAAIITDALSESQRINDTDDVALALAVICDDWLQAKGAIPVSQTLGDYLERGYRLYGERLEVATGEPKTLTKGPIQFTTIAEDAPNVLAEPTELPPVSISPTIEKALAEIEEDEASGYLSEDEISKILEEV